MIDKYNYDVSSAYICLQCSMRHNLWYNDINVLIPWYCEQRFLLSSLCVATFDMYTFPQYPLSIYTSLLS